MGTRNFQQMLAVQPIGESVSGTDPHNTKIPGAAYSGYRNSDVRKGSMFCQSEMTSHFSYKLDILKF